MKRFLARCEECGSVCKVKRDATYNHPTYKLPFTWMTIEDNLVCSFKCAKNRIDSFAHKTLGQILMSKFFHAATFVPGVN